MSQRREELTRIAARLFAERGYQGTSLADLADELGVQKPSLYHHIDSKEDLLWAVAHRGTEAFHAALDGVPPDAAGDGADPSCATCAPRASSQASSTSRPCSCASGATWAASGAIAFVAERRRYEQRVRDLFRDGVEGSELRTDLDVATAALLFLSAANWAYAWLQPGADVDALADRLYAVLLDGMRGYATP